MTASTDGNKVVFKGYTRKPVLEEQEGGILSVSAGDPCDGAAPPTGDPGPDGEGEPEDAAFSAKTALGFALPVALGVGAGLPMSASVAVGSALGFLAGAPRAAAQTVSECELAPIEGKPVLLITLYVTASNSMAC